MADAASSKAAPASDKLANAKKTSQPPTSDMVFNAIAVMKERGGSSLQAIKKYIAANYIVDAEKRAPFIKKYLKIAVESGILIQTKGHGASGSFKIGPAGKKAAAAAAEPKTTSVDKKKKPVKPMKAATAVEKKTVEKKISEKKTSEKKTDEKKIAGKKIDGKTTAKKKTATKAKPARMKALSPSKAKMTVTASPIKRRKVKPAAKKTALAK